MPNIKDLATVLSLLIAAAALWRNLKGDSKLDGAQISEILVKMELMASDIKEIKSDFKAEIKSLRTDFKAEVKPIKTEVDELKERLTVAEQSLKSAHKRIDELLHSHTEE